MPKAFQHLVREFACSNNIGNGNRYRVLYFLNRVLDLNALNPYFVAISLKKEYFDEPPFFFFLDLRAVHVGRLISKKPPVLYWEYLAFQNMKVIFSCFAGYFVLSGSADPVDYGSTQQ
jgi:hypothetical protein